MPMPPGKAGRRPADRRVPVRRPGSPYFRTADDGVLVARATAIEPSGAIDQAVARVRRVAFGRPLSNSEESAERLSKVKALAVFSSDNLSSVAYATEAILFTLLAAGTATFGLALPISALIVAVLAVIVVSYRQTIRAYPNGGGSYIVARENLGRGAGLVAAAALLTDYVLTVSVSVAAGVAAITSAFPGAFDGARVELAAVGIAIVMLINLRGARESGTIFAIPTYVFVGSMLSLIGLGMVRTLIGQPPTVSGVVAAAVPAQTFGVLLLMRAFADGCTAITGVEAVSNGVPAFKRSESWNARVTLTVMAVLVGIMFLGTSWLAGVAGALPAERETVLSQLGRAVFGGVGPAYFVLQLSTMGILVLAANTAFADFPRLSSLLARDGYMPSRFAFRGERLAFSTGIVALAVLSILVLGAFGGRVEALIPLYAVGVFTSITLSQAGMVRHWWRSREPGRRRSLAINGVGAVATGVVALIFAVAKFALGAWLIVIVIPLLVGAMLLIHHRYERRRIENAVGPELVVRPPHRSQRVIVPIADVSRDAVHALTFARTMSDDVTAVHVTDDAERGMELRARFQRQIPGIPLVLVESPYPDARPAAGALPRGGRASRRRRGRDRADAGVRPTEPVRAVPLQRQRAAHPGSPPRPPERARGRGPIPASRLTQGPRSVLDRASGLAHDPARLGRHPQELAEVVHRPDVARLPRVDGPDRHPIDRQPQRDAARDHLDLELEARLVAVEHRPHHPASDQPIARLVVRNVAAQRHRQRRAADHVRQAPHRRHLGEVAPADDEARMAGIERLEEGRDVVGVVLAIGIEGDHGRDAVVQGVAEARPQRGALTGVRDLAQDRRSRGLRVLRRVVRGAVVDDDHRQVPTCTVNHVSDPQTLLIRRDQRDDAFLWVGHAPSIAAPILRTDSGTAPMLCPRRHPPIGRMRSRRP